MQHDDVVTALPPQKFKIGLHCNLDAIVLEAVGVVREKSEFESTEGMASYVLSPVEALSLAQRLCASVTELNSGPMKSNQTN